MDVTKQQWLDWRSQDVTKEFLKRLFEKREELKEGIVEENIPTEKRELYIGHCQAYKDAIDYGLETFEVVKEEQSVS